jgi:hypothetical protein
LSVLYTVRCRFTDPEREDAWNAWYRGHLDVLLSVPGFLTAQRFHSTQTPDDRPYLAMYEVAGPEVFTSDAYLAIWGFDEWKPLIDHWTRDLSEPLTGEGFDYATPADARLRAAFLTGPEASVRDALAGQPDDGRARVTGLDRSCGGIAWRVLSPESKPDAPLEAPGLDVAQSVYEPLTEWLTSDVERRVVGR